MKSPLIAAVDSAYRAAVARALVLAVAVALGLVGCGTVHAPDEHLIAPDAPPMESPAVMYRVGFLPLVVDAEFKSHLDDVNGAGTLREYVYLPGEELRRKLIADVVAANEQLKTFGEVVFLPGAEGRGMDDVLRDAWDDGLDVIARPVLRKHDCYYVKQTGAWVPNLLLWLIALPPATWWIADETFGSVTTMEIELYSTATRATVPFATLEATGDVRHDLDDFQQGFNLVNLFITPSGLSPGHWEDIGNNLLPLSRQEAQRALLEICTGHAADSLAETFQTHREKSLTKTLAVVCGTTPGDGTLPRFAGNDAEALREFLLAADGRQPIAREWAITSLDGARATKQGLLGAIRQTFAKYGREGDTAWLAISARGMIDPDGSAYLLLADSVGADYRQSGLALTDLADELADLPCTVVVVGAVSWEWAGKPYEPPNEDTRRMGGESGGVVTATAQQLPSPWAAMASLPGVVILSATNEAGAVFEMEQIPGSLFVSEFIRTACAGEATDANHDGFLTLGEIADPVRHAVLTLTQREGIPQLPTIYGAEFLRNRRLIRLAVAAAPTAGAEGGESPGAPANGGPAGGEDSRGE